MSTEMVKHPQHYGGKIECIDIINEIVEHYSPQEAFCVGNVIKYIFRAPMKGEKQQDLEKARQYLTMLLLLQETKKGDSP